MNGPGIDWLSAAEQELFPGIPYQSLTSSQREAAIDRAKELVFKATGKKIR